MEFDENDEKPVSLQDYFISQVQEQSPRCDVTVKVGNWERRLHSYVLDQSPFFDCILRNEFLENRTGKIEIRIGTPKTVEMALMFLYGEKPELTFDNVEIMMRLAEFFIIPKLKTACVHCLKTKNVTEENCFSLLQLCSTFDINLPQCTKYVDGHLNELCERKEFVQIEAEFIEYMFTDPRFSYLCVDKKIKFLISWAKWDLSNRKNDSCKLLHMLNVEETNSEVLKEIEGDPVFAEIYGKELPIQVRSKDDEKQEVIIMQTASNAFKCLDLSSNSWYQMTISTDVLRRCMLFETAGIDRQNSRIYFSAYKNSIIYCADFKTNEWKNFPVLKKHKFYYKTLMTDTITISGDLCIASENKTVTIKKRKPNQETILGRLRSLIDGPSYTEVIENVETSNVYTGYLSDSKFKSEVVFTVLKHRIMKMCLNSTKTVLIITSSSKYVLIYDMEKSSLETVETTADHNDRVAPSGDGFIIYRGCSCTILQKVSCSSASSRYQAKFIDFDHASDPFCRDVEMFFISDRWVRCYKYMYRNFLIEYAVEWTSYEDFLKSNELNTLNKATTVQWNKLPIPDEYFRWDVKNIFMIHVPRNSPRCILDCPHCIAQQI